MELGHGDLGLLWGRCRKEKRKKTWGFAGIQGSHIGERGSRPLCGSRGDVVFDFTVAVRDNSMVKRIAKVNKSGR